MKLDMPPGNYVVAVSGGVDSVVLLDLLRYHSGLKLTVAHFDHGIRSDSRLDRIFVQQLAHRYQLPFVFDAVTLGPGASEAAARKARYAFLKRAQQAAGAQAIITAHHQDDMLETAVLNLLRGTGRKGLSSLTTGEGVIRPLLEVPKSELLDYARRHRLSWREDSTNNDTNYLRNHIRHVMLPSWREADKQRLLGIIRHMREVNGSLDAVLDDSLTPQLKREWFVLLPHNVAREVMASWLRSADIREFDRRTLERLVVAGKVAEAGKAIDVVKGRRMRVGRDHLALEVH
ncbi:MAG TPA: tRNA lysidine(34) synthetase TilS [Candidatus Saccharimonadales bacterium]|nr:tRNA lysidine(34) synthetase TilS [Candidatus Saccharimonadales bacterium]